MCSKIIQLQATHTVREGRTVLIKDSEGESSALWLGHVRDDNPKRSEMKEVQVPGIEVMEHHGLRFTFHEPVTIKGFVRNMMVRGERVTGLFLLTKSIQTRNGPDRWPVLSAGGRWRDLISQVSKIGRSKQ